MRCADSPFNRSRHGSVGTVVAILFNEPEICPVPVLFEITELVDVPDVTIVRVVGGVPIAPVKMEFAHALRCLVLRQS